MARNGFSAGPLARFLRLMQECLPRHNMGEWFRREGTMLIAYFTLGSFAYSYFEAWSTLDSVYFMVVTSTTVGYGDISPESASGRLFTCAYSLVGITLVLAAIAPFIDWILRARQVVERFLTAVAACCVSVPREVEVHDLSADIKHTNQRINYPLRYLRAMLGPLMVLCVGVLLAFFIFGCVGSQLRPAPPQPSWLAGCPAAAVQSSAQPSARVLLPRCHDPCCVPMAEAAGPAPSRWP